jgi:hypothetical protein
MPYYRLFEADGSDAGEIHLAVLVKPGETIFLGPGSEPRVVDLVLVEEDDSRYEGFLKVEAA